MPDASVDTVYCLNAFFFFPDPATAMAEMTRILRPGGRIAIITAPPEWKGRVGRVSPKMAQAMRFDSPENLTAWGGVTGLHDIHASVHAGAGLLFVARR